MKRSWLRAIPWGPRAAGDGAAEHHQRAKQLFLSLGEAITDESDEAMCDLLMDMKDLFESAVNRTLDQCRRNFKLAIPCYFPTRNTMSMLLPISLLPAEKRRALHGSGGGTSEKRRLPGPDRAHHEHGLH